MPDAPATNYPNLDAARVLAAYAVIWIHTARCPEMMPSVALGRFAVPFYLAAAVLLIIQGARRGRQRRFLAYLGHRSRRLLLPFAAWSGLYLLLKAIKYVALPNQPNDFPGAEALLVGTAYHLWFLPFLFAVSVVVYWLGALLSTPRTRGPVLVVALVSGLGWSLLPVPTTSPRWEAVQFMWLALPGVCWAVVLATVWTYWPERRRHTSWWRGLAVLLWTAATCWLWSTARQPLAEAMAGLAFLCLALDERTLRGAAWLGQFAPLAYGVYLSHLLWIKIGEAVFQHIGQPRTAAADLALFALVAWLSTVTAWLLSRWQRTRWLLG
jgi:surface polysaccharide O-acyltransferase-like enzyme